MTRIDKTQETVKVLGLLLLLLSGRRGLWTQRVQSLYTRSRFAVDGPRGCCPPGVIFKLVADAQA